MEQGNKQQKVSWIMLAVYVPALLFALFHTHPNLNVEIDICEQCETHQPCPGHITDASVSLHECIFCHFLTLPYVSASTLLLASVNICITISRSFRTPSVCRVVSGIVGLRAPPAVLL